MSDSADEARAALDRALATPPTEIKAVVDEAERAVVRVRDEFIGCLRQAHTEEHDCSWRTELERVNGVISLLSALEYPAAGVQRQLLTQARAALQGISSPRV